MSKGKLFTQIPAVILPLQGGAEVGSQKPGKCAFCQFEWKSVRIDRCVRHLIKTAGSAGYNCKSVPEDTVKKLKQLYPQFAQPDEASPAASLPFLVDSEASPGASSVAASAAGSRRHADFHMESERPPKKQMTIEGSQNATNKPSVHMAIFRFFIKQGLPFMKVGTPAFREMFEMIAKYGRHSSGSYMDCPSRNELTHNLLNKTHSLSDRETSKIIHVDVLQRKCTVLTDGWSDLSR
uniref:DUF659 domain-containing protein n=1 Tax=Chromera velia CCMP2878 TaxID=1169474 RepID=A0A0G4IAW2_9ALVE|eukprot:Cvel_2158.t1-p1 / transcript=Cvel_2158.t1 / gene=Cvel_2158 / organism=Chromera_velia_CCMP2878 / gene_product=hypothetical protein / transcript_product=hypothetical protein / location=Cvel_scaffold83:145551-146258(+) / protein_length=236 / sequence_SO=supercontig / SO=protein_coding / is_pseudo=false